MFLKKYRSFLLHQIFAVSFYYVENAKLSEIRLLQAYNDSSKIILSLFCPVRFVNLLDLQLPTEDEKITSEIYLSDADQKLIATQIYQVIEFCQ